MHPFTKFGLAALAGYAGTQIYQRGGYANRIIGFGSPTDTIRGVDPRKLSAAQKGLVSYGIFGPDGRLITDMTGFRADTGAKLVKALTNSRRPLYAPAALEAARTVPFSIKGQKIEPGSKSNTAYRNPPMFGGFLTEKAVSDVFWSRTSAKIKEDRPVAATVALASVLATHRLGYTLGNPRKLLGSSTKTIKGAREAVLTRVMYLSAADESGVQTCLKRGDCELSCLGWSTGQMVFDTSLQSRIGKTLLWWFDRPGFLTKVSKEINATLRSKDAKDLRALAPSDVEPIIAFRLNGSSDLRWEFAKERLSDGGALPDGRSIIEAHPDVTFYDYTKYTLNTRRFRINGGPANYHVVYSFDEKPDAMKNAREYLTAGGNSAVVVGARMSDAAFRALKPIHDEIVRLTGDAKGACALPVGDSDVDPLQVQVERLRERGAQLAEQYGVTKNAAKAGAFHVLFPGDELLSDSRAAAYPALWAMERSRFMRAAQQAGVLDRDDERNTYDNLLGRALFNYEKAVYKQEGLEAIPWNPSTRSWIGGFTTIDADVTDARFLDPPATWNVLYAKGPAAWDVSGFVVRVDRDGLPYFLDASGAGLVRGSLARMGRRAARYRRLPAPRYYRTRR
jgi:hypothetical protein